LALSFLVCLLGNLFLQVAGGPILAIFGKSYAEQAATSLHIIMIASLPSILKEHYTAICRMQRKMARAMLPAALGSLLELGFAALGARFGGLNGLCLGWVIALVVEALYMSFPVYQATRIPSSVSIEDMPTAPIPLAQLMYETWRYDTQPLPVLLQRATPYDNADTIQQLAQMKQSNKSNHTQKRPVIKRYTLAPYENA
jgi:hypothetical protein